jgi:hypothetical protein
VVVAEKQGPPAVRAARDPPAAEKSEYQTISSSPDRKYWEWLRIQMKTHIVRYFSKKPRPFASFVTHASPGIERNPWAFFYWSPDCSNQKFQHLLKYQFTQVFIFFLFYHIC